MLRHRKRWPTDILDRARNEAIAHDEVRGYLAAVNGASPHGVFEVSEHIDFCFTCISKTLPLEEQVALLLRNVYRFTTEEVAGAMGVGEGAVKHYVRKHKTHAVETSDLARAFEEATGHNVDRFLDQYVYSPGHPELKSGLKLPVAWRRRPAVQIRGPTGNIDHTGPEDVHQGGTRREWSGCHRVENAASQSRSRLNAGRPLVRSSSPNPARFATLISLKIHSPESSIRKS